jgi:hypothetical protein
MCPFQQALPNSGRFRPEAHDTGVAAKWGVVQELPDGTVKAATFDDDVLEEV